MSFPQPSTAAAAAPTILEAERRALALSRGLIKNQQSDDGDWHQLIAIARAQLCLWEEFPHARLEEIYDEKAARPLMAAARVLDAASQFAPRLARAEYARLGLEAAVAFGMSGNFPSAAATVRRTFPTLNAPTEAARAVMACAAPALVLELMASCKTPSPARGCLHELQAFLQCGDEVKLQAARALLERCVLGADTTFERRFLLRALLCVEHIAQLSIARFMRAERTLPRGLMRGLAENSVTVFLPPQWKAISRMRLHDASTPNAIIGLAPSAGKTLIGELCLLSSFDNEPGLAVFIAPYVALGNQIAGTLEAHLEHSEVRVHRCLGGHAPLERLEPHTRMELVVATPERFDALLRHRGDALSTLRGVVCDEAHLIARDVRGARIESVLSRLRLLQPQHPQLKIVLLSAAFQDTSRLQQWIGATPQSTLFDEWKPTARRLAVWTRDGVLSYHDAEYSTRENDSSVIGHKVLSWPQPQVFPTEKWIGVQRGQERVWHNVSHLARLLNDEYDGAILCVCASKASTRALAAVLAASFPALVPQGFTAQVIEYIKAHHRFLKPLAQMLERGVAYHNAGLPHAVRVLIERAIKAGELRAVASTTTLAEGVDFPFRFTIVCDWLQWESGAQRPMSPQLFANIAGRCGRAGVYTEGDTILLDNPLGDLKFTDETRRHDLQNRLYFSRGHAQIESALSSHLPLICDDGDNYNSQVFDALISSQFLAAIHENPNAPNVASRFAASTYAACDESIAAKFHEKLCAIKTELLREPTLATCDEAEVLALTPLGEAVRLSEFSIGSARRIVSTLHALPRCEMRNDDTKSIARITSFLLRALGNLPENSNADLRKMLISKRSRFCLKPQDFECGLELWLRGEAHETIFAALPYTQNSSREINVDDWIGGEGVDFQSANWSGELDRFAEFSRAVFETFLPWLLRACEKLCVFAREDLSKIEWRLWAEYFEHGVDSRGALELLNRNAPATRKAIACLARNQNDFESALREAGGKYCADGQSVLELKQWLLHLPSKD